MPLTIPILYGKQFKVPVQMLDPQMSDGTNLRLTNARQYKRQTRTNVGPVQTSEWDKCRTVQTSDQYKHWTSTNVRPVQMSD